MDMGILVVEQSRYRVDCRAAAKAPVMTGEIENGRSSIVIIQVLPTNSFRAMSIAAVMPNAVLIGTATAASMSVNFTCRQHAKLSNYDSLCGQTLFAAGSIGQQACSVTGGGCAQLLMRHCIT